MAKPARNRDPEVPAWVATAISLITFVLCWSVGVFLVVSAEPGDWKRLVIAGGFIIFPFAPVSLPDLIRAWREQK